MNIRRRSSVFVFYIIACNTAIWRYENKRVNLFWRDEESQPFQRKYASYELLPELATISWIACLLASAEGPVLHSLSPCQSSQVNWPQTLRGNYCTCSWSLSSINGENMTSCASVFWICHCNSWISYPRLCFIGFQMKFNYPVPGHFQFSGRDGSGNKKWVLGGWETGIPSGAARDPWSEMQNSVLVPLNIYLLPSLSEGSHHCGSLAVIKQPTHLCWLRLSSFSLGTRRWTR